MRPQSPPAGLDKDIINRFFSYDPSRVKILPHSFREALGYPVDESKRKIIEEALLNKKILVIERDPNVKPLLTEAYLREIKRSE